MRRALEHSRNRTALLGAMGFAFLLAAQPSFADSQPPPFAAGKPHEGQMLVQRDCIACHAQRYAGDHEQIYLRLDRRVRTPAQLMAQIQRCNTELGTNYFPEEEEHVAAYLNLHYYKFE